MRIFKQATIAAIIFLFIFCMPQMAMSQESSSEEENETPTAPAGISSVDFSTDSLVANRNLWGLASVTKNPDSSLVLSEAIRVSGSRVMIVGKMRGVYHFKNESVYAGMDGTAIFVGLMDHEGYLYFHRLIPADGELHIGGGEVRVSSLGQYIIDVLYSEFADDTNVNVRHAQIFSDGDVWGRVLFQIQGNGLVSAVEGGRMAVNFRGSLTDAGSGQVYTSPNDRTRGIVFDYMSVPGPVKLRTFTADRLRIRKILGDGSGLVAVAGEYGGCYGNRTSGCAHTNNVFTSHKKPTGKWKTSFYTPSPETYASFVSEGEVEGDIFRVYVRNISDVNLSFVTTGEMQNGALTYKDNLTVTKNGKTVNFSRDYLEQDYLVSKTGSTAADIVAFNGQLGNMYSYEEMVSDVEIPRCKDQQCHSIGVGEACGMGVSGACLPEGGGAVPEGGDDYKRCELDADVVATVGPRCVVGAHGKICSHLEMCEDITGVCEDQKCVDISLATPPANGSYTYCTQDIDCPKKHCDIIDGEYKCIDGGSLGECEIDAQCYEGKKWCELVPFGGLNGGVGWDCTPEGRGHGCAGPENCSFGPIGPPKRACLIDATGQSPLPKAQEYLCSLVDNYQGKKLCPSGNPWDCVPGALKRCQKQGNEYICTVTGDGKECIEGQEDKCSPGPTKHCNLDQQGNVTCIEGGNKLSECENAEKCKALQWCGKGLDNTDTCDPNGSGVECLDVKVCEGYPDPPWQCEVWDMKGDFPDRYMTGSFPAPFGALVDLLGGPDLHNFTIQIATPGMDGRRFFDARGAVYFFCVHEF